jgi:diamine N-acetyltransferase
MLKGEKIALRAAEPSDVDVIYSWENDPENWLVSNTVAPYSKHQILQFIEDANDIFASNQLRLIISNHQQEAVGCMDLFDFDHKNKRVGLGVLVDENHRGKGYAQEALLLTINYCFNLLEVHSLYAEVLSSNKSSQRLFESAGFIQTGIKKEWLWAGQDYVDQIFYQLIR